MPKKNAQIKEGKNRSELVRTKTKANRLIALPNIRRRQKRKKKQRIAKERRKAREWKSQKGWTTLRPNEELYREEATGRDVPVGEKPQTTEFAAVIHRKSIRTLDRSTN